MRAVLLTDYGNVDRLELGEVPEPVAAAGEIKVRVSASSVNPVDWKMRRGSYGTLTLPAILGRDAAGEVVNTGPGESAFRVGTRVLGLVNKAYAEFVVDKESAWAEAPSSIDLVDAAALPLVALTGAQLIREAVRSGAGDVVLVTGAVGSVGRAAVFTARAAGATVLAGVRASQREAAEKLNVGVIALDDEADIKRLPQLDCIADTVGGDTLEQLLDKVRKGGTVGSVLGEPRGAKERGLVVRALQSHPDSKLLAELAQAAAAGDLVIPIAKRMPLNQVREAQTLAERGGAGGKIVLRVR